MKRLYRWLCLGVVMVLCNGAPQCVVKGEEEVFLWKVHEQDFKDIKILKGLHLK